MGLLYLIASKLDLIGYVVIFQFFMMIYHKYDICSRY